MNRKLTSYVTIILTVISIATLFVGCSSTADNQIPQSETKIYTYQNLEIELSNVKSDRTETMTDDGGQEWKFTVITYYPGARITVNNADMSDPTYNEDGKAHPQWGILLDSDERIKITDDMPTLDITSDMVGIYNLEASLFVFKFESNSE